MKTEAEAKNYCSHHSTEQTLFLRKSCPHCGRIRVEALCPYCAARIKAKKKRFTSWTCAICDRRRPIKEGMDIYGEV